MHEVELYEFSGSEVFRLTPHEVVVEMGGDAYQPAPIQRNPLALGAEAAKSALELSLPPDHAVVRHLLRAATLGHTTEVVLRMARRSTENSDTWTLDGARWMGRVLGVEVSDEAARIRCEPALVSLKRIGLRRLYSRACSHVLYSQACGATPVSASATVVHTEGSRVYLDGGVPAALGGALAGGWLETASGMRYMIVTEYVDAVELLYPVAVQAGHTVVLVAGCDHTMTTCRERFDNLANYGGFPFIPLKNPFATGVF
ncbi:MULTISPECIES: DUF2163 domain-containing protein [Caldimonas]|uniref:DUF2163 domain-containing protein n=1 Tax=Caldimonas TaxID=196013 RepID=UPI00036237B5|nr:DUF2163 domain-containing protein [Caldimonas manganoxidans]